MLPQPRVLAALLLASVAPASIARADAAADVFADLFGEQRKQVRATASKSDDVELAGKMLETARTVQDDTLVVLLCDSAYELTSTTSKGYQTAADAMRLLAQRVPSQSQRCREELFSVLPRLYANSRDEQKADAGRALARMLEESADQKVDSGDLEGAIDLLERASTIATAVKADPFDEVKSRLDRLAAKRRARIALERLTGRLAADPADGEAGRQLVRLCMIDLDDPAEALSYANHVDADMQQRITWASGDPGQLTAQQCESLADWYTQLTAEAGDVHRAAMLRRAIAYYQRYLERHPEQDLARTRAEVILGRLKDRLAKLEPPIIDLLELVDPERDAAIGQWSWVDGKLQCQPIKDGHLLLPVVVEGSYEFYLQFCRVAGNDTINPLIPVGGCKCAVVLGGWDNKISGLSDINGKPAIENETAVRTFRMRNGLMYSVLISVDLKGDRAQIVAVVNNKPLIRWQGTPSALGFRPTRNRAHLRARTPGMPTLGAWMSKANFHVAKLKVLDGKATMLSQDRQLSQP